MGKYALGHPSTFSTVAPLHIHKLSAGKSTDRFTISVSVIHSLNIGYLTVSS